MQLTQWEQPEHYLTSPNPRSGLHYVLMCVRAVGPAIIESLPCSDPCISVIKLSWGYNRPWTRKTDHFCSHALLWFLQVLRSWNWASCPTGAWAGSWGGSWHYCKLATGASCHNFHRRARYIGYFRWGSFHKPAIPDGIRPGRWHVNLFMGSGPN